MSSQTENYECPACAAQYLRVPVAVAPTPNGRMTVPCRVCRHPLEGANGETSWSYYFVRRGQVGSATAGQ